MRVHRLDAKSELRLKDMGMVSTIQRALDRGTFVLYRQRIQGLHEANRADAHFEILLQDDRRGRQAAATGQFLPAAERYNLDASDRPLVIGAALVLARLVRGPERQSRRSSTINLSGASLNDPGFAPTWKRR